MKTAATEEPMTIPTMAPVEIAEESPDSTVVSERSGMQFVLHVHVDASYEITGGERRYFAMAGTSVIVP